MLASLPRPLAAASATPPQAQCNDKVCSAIVDKISRWLAMQNRGCCLTSVRREFSPGEGRLADTRDNGCLLVEILVGAVGRTGGPGRRGLSCVVSHSRAGQARTDRGAAARARRRRAARDHEGRQPVL